MAVAKLSSNKKVIMFIDDEGNVFATSAAYMKQLLYGYKEKNMVLLSRYPQKASEDRFMKSPLYDPSGKMESNENKTLTSSNDSLSVKTREENKQTEVYNKIVTDF